MSFDLWHAKQSASSAGFFSPGSKIGDRGIQRADARAKQQRHGNAGRLKNPPISCRGGKGMGMGKGMGVGMDSGDP